MDRMSRSLTAPWLALLLSLSRSGLAEDDRPAPVPLPPSAAAVSGPVSRMTEVTLGLAWGRPTRLTGSATLMWGRPKMLLALSPGRLVQVRLGAGGGQVAVGLVAGAFEASPFKPSGLAMTLKAIAIRTWRDPLLATYGQSYAGLESDVVLLGVRGSIGYARRVGGSGGPDGRFIWSLGLGL